MSRFSGRVLWSIAVLAAVVAMAQVAEAQREGGRRGRGGRFGFGGGWGTSPVQLAAEAEEVQTALKLTDDQKTKVEEINDQLREDRMDLFQQGGGGGDFRANLEEREKLGYDASAKLADVLDEGQLKRLMGISIQVIGANAIFEPYISKELNVSDEQKTKLTEVRDSNFQAMMEAGRDLRDQELSPEEMRAKFQELRSEGDQKLLAELSSEQQDQYKALMGEKVEIDMSQFRRGFGGGGRGFGGGGRGRDRGNRNNDGGSNENNN